MAYFQKARDADPNHWQSLLNWLLVEAFDRRDAAAAQRLFDELKQRYPEIPQLDKIQEQISSGLRRRPPVMARARPSPLRSLSAS